MEKNLILLISCTEVLQELMSQFHDILHSDIFTLKRKIFTIHFLIMLKKKKRKAAKPRSLISKNQLHLLVGDLQELQHHTVSSHVPQQPLLLLLTLLP